MPKMPRSIPGCLNQKKKMEPWETDDEYWDEIDFAEANSDYHYFYDKFMRVPWDDTINLPPVITLKEYDNLVEIIKVGQKAIRCSGILSTIEGEYDFTDEELVFEYEESPDRDTITDLDEYWRAKEEYDDFMDERKTLVNYVYDILESKRFYDKNPHLIDCRVC